MQKISLSIPEPCHEDWQNMTASEQGRFCSSCQKQVIDFTLMSDAEVYGMLSKSNANVCGRFDNSQLQHPISLTVPKKIAWHKYFFSLAIPTVLISRQASAQKLMGKVAYDPKASNICMKPIPSVTKAFSISGIVIDSSGHPIVGATIEFLGQGVFANNLGQFILNSATVDSKIKLVISSLGYESKTIDIDIPINNFKIADVVISLKQHINELDGVVVVATTKYSTIGAMSYGVCITNRTRVLEAVKKTVTVISDSLKIYPSPVPRGNNISIDLKLKKEGDYTIQVSDINGRVFLQQPFKAASTKFNTQISTDRRWVAGIYVMRVLNEGKLIGIRRFVIQ